MQNSTTVESTSVEEQEAVEETKDLTTENLFDWNSIRLPQDYNLASGVTKALVRIPIEKPNRHEFIRVHPTLSFQTWAFEDKADKEIYVLMNQQLMDELSAELVPKVFYVYVNRSATLKLWPITLPSEDGKINGWAETAAKAAEIAKTKWVRVAANRGAGGYDVWIAENQIIKPKWDPIVDEPRALDKILEIAFREKRIYDTGHPIIQKNLKGM